MEVMEPALLNLLDEGRAAGLRVMLEGPDEVVVLCGPRSAEPVAKALLEFKPELRALLKPVYSLPWPEILPDLSRRAVDFITWCQTCQQRSTWVRYADRPTCLLCAIKAAEAARVPARPEQP
jgi:hypothetical protein